MDQISRDRLAQSESIHLPIQKYKFDSQAANEYFFHAVAKNMCNFDLFELLSIKNWRHHLVEEESWSYTLLLSKRDT